MDSIFHPISIMLIMILPLFKDKTIFPSIFLYPIFFYCVPFLKQKLLLANIHGKDLHKKNNPIIPEAFGVLPSLLYLLYQYFALPIEMHTTLLAICFVILLGFFDDILDLPWRIKIILPLIATIPIL